MWWKGTIWFIRPGKKCNSTLHKSSLFNFISEWKINNVGAMVEILMFSKSVLHYKIFEQTTLVSQNCSY